MNQHQRFKARKRRENCGIASHPGFNSSCPEFRKGRRSSSDPTGDLITSFIGMLAMLRRRALFSSRPLPRKG